MKSNELMICDWVNWHTYTDAPNYCRITKVEYGKILDCKPIPLTPEILEMNGWHGDELGWVIEPTNGFDEYLNIIFRTGKVFSLEIHRIYGNDMLLKSIHYIHELQHALRLCGLNDMANNFEV